MITIIGAGMSGLLAANMVSQPYQIMERASGIPNNHMSLLRFRTGAVGDVCSIPFRKVKVMKTSTSEGNNDVADAMSYSRKVTGGYHLRSSSSAFKTEVVERYIAPTDLIEGMAKSIPQTLINFRCDLQGLDGANLIFTKDDEVKHISLKEPVISTIPMIAMMKVLGWPGPNPSFGYRSGFSVQFRVRNCDAHVTTYITNRRLKPYRASITGNLAIIEYAFNRIEMSDDDIIDDASEIAERLLGIFPQDVDGPIHIHTAQYAKIVPIDETTRRNFILWASIQHNVYSLGRFATWRPGLLMDDVVNDIRVIERLMSGNHLYEHLLKG